MEVKAKHNRIVEYVLTEDEWKDMKTTLRGACLSETLGPNWRNIYWFNNRPYVLLK